jgi:NADH-quinone oxidoreductase subunit H
MAGWASNNKFSLIGAFRMVAMVVSYEVPMVITLLVPVILSRSMSLNAIVNNQSIWYIVLAPVAAFIFLVSVIAELGRAPFDLAEAESELVAGYHIEYSGMKFGMFYAGELLHSLTMGALFATLFLGGWRGPGAQQFPILGILYLFLKSIFFYWVLGWVKYSLPRFRIDFVLNFNWKFLTPLALGVVLITAVLDNLLGEQGTLLYTAGMLIANIFIIWVTVLILNKYAKTERKKVAEVRPTASPDLTKAAHG